MTDKPLYDAMAFGLMKTEKEMEKLGVDHWKVAMVAYDPDNPRAYMVIGSAGEEDIQQKLVAVICPEDANRPPDFIANNQGQPPQVG